MTRLILASRSPRRAELLSREGFAFVIHDPAINEIEEAPPRELCMENARRKARATARRFENAVVLAADTVVALPDKVFGKPADLDEALSMLRALAGRTHDVLTGVCLTGNHHTEDFIETTRVTFHPPEKIDFEACISRMNPLDKAGAYAAQEDNGNLIASIDGCIDNVIGLPVSRVTTVLANTFRIFPASKNHLKK
jgi:septum formation protein